MVILQGLDALSINDQTLLNEFCQGPTLDRPFHVIHKAFEHFADTTPTTVAAFHNGMSVTYGELEAAANTIGNKLVALGLRPRERVCMVVSRSIEMLVAILAILKCGCQYIPLDGKVVADQTLLHILRDANTRFILCLKEFSTRCSAYSDSGTTTVTIGNCVDESGLRSGRVDCGIGPNDGAYIIYTSGTTGKPKGVDVTHGNATNLLTVAPGNLGIKPGSKVTQLLSVSFDMAAWEILGTLMNGGTLYIRTSDWNATICQVDTIIATPSILGTLKQDQFPNLNVVAVAGESCLRHLADSWSKSVELYNCSGPTEVTIVNTMNRQIPGQGISIGKPIPNTNIYILDDNEQLIPVGESGLMWAGGACVSRGYLYLPEETAKRFKVDRFTRDGGFMYNTGDCGKWRPDGTLEPLGQVDDQVKVKGFRVDLYGVSAVVENHPKVRTACTILHEKLLWTFYEVEPDTPGELIDEYVQKFLPYYAVPIQSQCALLPKTPNGKIDKKELALWAEAQRTNTVCPRSSVLSTPISSPHVVVRKETVATVQSHSSDSMSEMKEAHEPTYELPPKKGIHRVRALRHRFFSLYRRFFSVVLLGNLAAVIVLAVRAQQTGNLRLSDLATATSVNVTVAILFRQDYVINLLFTIFCSIPTSAPLFIRRNCAKIYNIGGIHSGCGVAATVWFIAFTVVATRDFIVNAATRTSLDPVVLVLTYLLLILLVGILALAYPTFRSRYHNHFELAHRLLGWSALALFWGQTLILTAANSRSPGQLPLGPSLARSPSFYLLLTSTFSVLLPWLRLRRVPVVSEVLSSHAIRLHFSYCTPVPGTAVRISERPLIEWHAFATVARPHEKGFSLVVSNAGDWTSRQIARAPTSLYVRGVPACGVLRIAPLFRSIVLVATGSGIGPCLPVMMAKRVLMRVFWSTPHPEETFGKEIVGNVRATDAAAVIHNTRSMGKPDMVAITWRLLQESGAEAVVIISNQKLTQKVVYAMESRGVPAYGAIWDS